MRLGAWLCAGAGLLLGLLGGCSGDYPLPPTPCDDWCHASQGGWSYCGGFYDPASCVSQCEQEQLSGERCRPLLDAALNCYRVTPNVLSEQCKYDPNNPRPCQTELGLLTTCASSYYFEGPQPQHE